MSRKEIMADVIAHLEAERFAPPHRGPQYRRPPPEPVTPEQARRNRRAVMKPVDNDQGSRGELCENRNGSDRRAQTHQPEPDRPTRTTEQRG